MSNKVRFALIAFHEEINKYIDELVELEDISPSKSMRFSYLSKREKFFVIIKLIVDWYQS